MEISKIDNQIKLNTTKLQIADNQEDRTRITNTLTRLRYQREIELIRDKIRRIESN